MQQTAEISPFYAQGLRFSCTRCSSCCRFEKGYVFLSQKDASKLAASLNMDYNNFIERYCRWIPSMNGGQNRKLELSLKEKSNYDCIFWTPELSTSPQGGLYGTVSGVPNEGCQVYESRPLQCRSFPFWQSVLSNKGSWEMTSKDCPGMGRGVHFSQDSIKKWLAMRHNEPIISRNSVSKGEF